MSTTAERFLEQFETLSGQLPGLGTARRAAMDRFMATGLPSARHEDWKYTRITPIEKREFVLAPADAPDSLGTDERPALSADDCAGLGPGALDAHVLTFVNGRFEPSVSSIPAAYGIDVTPVGEALRAGDDVLAPYVLTDDETVTAFTALNTAFVRDGVLIRARENARLERPLRLRFVTATGETPLAAHPRIIVDLAEGAALDVLETYASTGGGSHFNNVYADIRLAQGACLRHCKLHEEGDAGVHIATTSVRQYAHSRYLSLSVALNGQLVRNDINCELTGTGAECSLDGLFMGGGRSHIDYHTRVDHKVAGARSSEMYKSVLGGRARGVFNGRVYVHPDAQGTDAHQKNDNLLLSRHAEIDTKPQLEIYADDVKCSHGATVGQLDADSLFYLRARGIDEQAARALIIYGFASDVLKRLPIAGLSDALEPRVLAHMPQVEPAIESAAQSVAQSAAQLTAESLE
ncbi:MAG: Fe-S cluster assembly protein SufD [Gammaproteobacteria bacterium]